MMELHVKQMTCGHCEAAVTRAVKDAAPQAGVLIDRARSKVEITGNADPDRVLSAIRAAGFEAAPVG